MSTNPLVKGVALVAAGALILQALVLWLVSSGRQLPVYVSLSTTDSIASKISGVPVTAPAVESVGTIPLVLLLGIVLVLSAILISLQATGVAARILRRVSEQRVLWLVIAVATAGLLLMTDLLSGEYDLRNLILLALLGIGATVGGLHLVLARSRRQAVMYLIVAAVPWLWALWTLICTTIFGSIHAVGAVWWLLLSAAAGVGLLIGHLILAQREYREWTNPTFVGAGTYVLLLAVETAYAWQVFAAFLHG